MATGTRGRPRQSGAPSRALEEVIEFVGTANELARRLGVTKQAVRQWRIRYVPADRVKAIVQLSEGRVSHRDLRPDLY